MVNQVIEIPDQRQCTSGNVHAFKIFFINLLPVCSFVKSVGFKSVQNIAHIQTDRKINIRFEVGIIWYIFFIHIMLTKSDQRTNELAIFSHNIDAMILTRDHFVIFSVYAEFKRQLRTFIQVNRTLVIRGHFCRR
ncbi:hypothetical protein D3C80_702610 [compost metagenome]